MESVIERPWNTEFRIQGKKLAEKVGNDFNEHLLKAEKILSERDKMLDKKEKDARDKLKTLETREKTLDARELELTERMKWLDTEKRNLEEERNKLASEKEKWKVEEEALFTKYRIKDKIIKLKVGEKIFETYQSTLMKDPDSMLATRFSGRHDPVMVDGAHFFDRDPKYFKYILNYLRDGNIAEEILPRNTDELHKILKEADYYQLMGLKEEVERIIQQSNSNTEEAAKTTMGDDTLTKKMTKIVQKEIQEREMNPDEKKAIEVFEELKRLKQKKSPFHRGRRQANIKEEIEKLYTSILQTFPKEILIDPVVIRKVITSLRQATGSFTNMGFSPWEDRALPAKVEQFCGQLQNTLPECLKGLSSRPLSAQQELAINSEDLKNLQTKIKSIDFRQIKCEAAAKILSEVCFLRSLVQ